MTLKRFFRRSHEDAELSQELESHLAHEIDDNLARGMSPEEARRRAYVKLGNPLVIRDKVWETNRLAWIEDTWRDLRYAARTLAKNPGFTAVALLVLALGIGANSAIYSFLDALLMRSLPVSDPASLAVLNWHAKNLDGDFVMHGMSGNVWDDSHLGQVSDIFPYAVLSVAEKEDKAFSDVFAYCHSREVRATTLLIHGQAESAAGELVSGRYFQALGIVPSAGRLITADDDRVGAPSVVVTSYGFAERHFGSADAATGQSVLLNNVPFTVIGVAPPEFFGVDPSRIPDFYVPLHTNLLLGASDSFGFKASDYLDQNYYWLQIMARLRPGVTLKQAQAELGPKFQQWVAATATNDRERANLPILQLREGQGGLDQLRREFSKPFLVLMILVALILAIACSNVANLLLARATTRRREIALRLSQGASRWRVIRQLLTESILLAGVGSALGLVLAAWAVRFLSALLPPESGTLAASAALNWRVFAITAGVGLLTGVIFGLVPALQSTKVELTSALKETVGTRQRPLRARWWQVWPVSINHVLVVSQISISLLILVAAGLFVHTLSNLQSINLGFNRENLLLFDVNARQAGHHDPELSEFYFRLRDELAALPGVRDAGLAQDSLVGGEDEMPISLPGLPPRDDTRFKTVGARFLTTMQIPMLAGRDIDDRDRPGSPAVAVVNENFAQVNFPGQNPVGKHILLWGEHQETTLKRDMEIVGVARNAHYGNLKNDFLPVVYLLFNQGFPPPNEMTFAIRTAGDPLAFVNSIRDVVRNADSHLPISKVRTQKAEIRQNMYEEAILADLSSAFAVLALVISCVGLYGTISYGVARRTGEIGIRMALGAQRGPVLWMVLREVCLLAALGLAISIPIALGTSKFLQSLLFKMKPNDPLALVAAVAILLVAALLAGSVPARRAANIDPMSALRHE
jgi:macrolide transport system ATP-binding/permease protein